MSDSLADCLLTYLERRPIDVDRARSQHVAYTSLLRDLGCELVWLDPLPNAPDAVFVEDTAVIAAPVAVVTRPGAESRRVETASTRAALAASGRPTAELAGGRLDGGDVLLVGRRLYVGMSERTDADGADALAAAVKPYKYEVIPVGVDGVLHLKTAVTALPDGTLVAAPDHIDVDAFRPAPLLPVHELTGADVLTVGHTVVVSASAPRSAAAISARGWDVRTIDVSEFELAEAGVTCMSIIDPR